MTFSCFRIFSATTTLIYFMFPLPGQTDSPKILGVDTPQEIVGRYGKLEISIDLSATYDNPYDYEDIEVSAVFSGPGGNEYPVDGFYMEDFELDERDGSLRPAGKPGGFRLRFSPMLTGNWSYRVFVRDRSGEATSDSFVFICEEDEDDANQGFVRAGLTNYLHFDSGKKFIPIGQNVAWPVDNPYLDYTKWLEPMRRNGGNYFRLWHAHWGLGIEWKDGWNDFEGLRRYQETNMRYQDWLFDYCAANGIYLMLALQHHGQVSSEVNPNWEDSPYNAANGGPCTNTWEFFSNGAAKAHTRNRFRYVLARWGYSRAIMAWELFNEVEWTDDFEQHRSLVQDWHFEMASFLGEKDPYGHLITTSFAHDINDPLVWNNPDLDITQTHYYLNTGNIERALAGGVRNYLDLYGKPTLTGEFGLGAYSSLSVSDQDGIHLHNGLWGALFGGGMGSAMSWWWDSYVHPRDLYYHFDGISQVVRDIPFDSENLGPGRSFVLGEPGDLSLIPIAGWGVIGDSLIRVGPNGWTQPSRPQLGIFLYGSEWNTEFRSPPSFEITYPSEGAFIVSTSNQLGEEAKIAIWLDGELVLEELAVIDTSYSIQVPAGQHIIRVDNTGKDWASVASYIFSGAGSEVDSYVLLSENREVAAGWVLNHRYNHKFLAENGTPTPVLGSELIVEDFRDGSYSIAWYDCISGEIIRTGGVEAVNGQLSIPLPELFWDLSFLVGGSELVAVEAVREEIDLEVFPNPVSAGGEIRLVGEFSEIEDGQVALLSASGQIISTRELSDATQTGFEMTLPAGLPGGVYWVRLQGEDRQGSRAILVGER